MGRQKKQPAVQPLLLTVPEVAIQLGVCRTTVYNLIYQKGLPTVMLGNSRRIHPESLQEWLKTCERLGHRNVEETGLSPSVGEMSVRNVEGA